MKYTILLIFSFLVVLSCKNDNKEKKATKESEKKEYFSLIFNAVVEYDDEFQLLYLEEDQENISMENAVIVNVSGSSIPQELTFRLDEEGVLPTKFFLRFGNEQKNQKISILKTQVFYGDNSFVIEKDKFYQFFNPNQFIDYDRDNFIAVSKSVNGDYKPFFGSRTVLNDRILFQFD